MPLPKQSSKYPVELAQACRRAFLSPVEFDAGTKSAANSFRAKFYGYVAAIEREVAVPSPSPEIEDLWATVRGLAVYIDESKVRLCSRSEHPAMKALSEALLLPDQPGKAETAEASLEALQAKLKGKR